MPMPYHPLHDACQHALGQFIVFDRAGHCCGWRMDAEGMEGCKDSRIGQDGDKETRCTHQTRRRFGLSVNRKATLFGLLPVDWAGLGWLCWRHHCRLF